MSFNQKLQKYGRTTEQTKGFVWATNVNVNVCYDSDPNGNCIQVAYFTGQIAVKGQGASGFSQGGDSGSLVLTNSRRPVGLLFAGGGGFTFVNRIAPVLDELSAILGGGTLTIDGA